MGNGYLRFAALGDSTTVGLGDPVPGGRWRGWARLLSEALQASYDVSFCNVAISGATAAVVREEQARGGGRAPPRPGLAAGGRQRHPALHLVPGPVARRPPPHRRRA
ncbi:hypothetical protein G5V59_09475 [Nocardioides sp. W3-2-3]|uniref:GDSL-type esterase/lipase family protein n=1 Tax=Nocardioides convexus TaxID=2712224 RepID=UPI0024187868|nr:GDSL-type esterase/lipase family protein [Nocardioides convexus]NHA00261.1 hypothetical protein [Nocardioides convexus]